MSTPTPPAGFVLAGGKSLRMGRDKAALDWHGRPLLCHMTDLLATVCDPVTVIGRDDLPDDIPHLGPIGGIATALRHSTIELNIIAAIDLPHLTADFLNYFKERCERSPRSLTACKIDSAFPFCLGVRLDLAPVIGGYISAGKRSLRSLITQIECQIITVDELARAGFSAALFANINTEEDYRAALNLDDP